MIDNDFFSISDFAEFSRTTRDTLLYYDKIGLLSPQLRGENNYRFYSHGQIAMLNMIRTCQVFGMTLTEIKDLKKRRSPELVEELLGQQISHIDEKIEQWINARKLLLLLKNTIQPVMNIDENEITVQFKPAEAIILGKLNDFSRNRTDYDALFNFYCYCHEAHPDLDLNYPVWGMFSEERLKKRDYTWPDRFYFYNPEGHDRKPASLYAIGHTRGGYGVNTVELYDRMLDYIELNGFEVCGPAYEEYPLNEICVAEHDNYLIRIMITVREKK